MIYHGALLLHDLLLHGFVHHAADLLLLAGLDRQGSAGHLGDLVTALLVGKMEIKDGTSEARTNLPTFGTVLQSSTSWQDWRGTWRQTWCGVSSQVMEGTLEHCFSSLTEHCFSMTVSQDSWGWSEHSMAGTSTQRSLN